MKYKNLTYLMTHPIILMRFLILFGVMMFLTGWQGRYWYDQSKIVSIATGSTKRYIGQPVQLGGSIKGQYGFGMFQFTNEKGDQFIVKSTTTNINQLTGKALLYGTIVSYNGLVPVVDVYQYSIDGKSSLPQFWYDNTHRIAFRPGYPFVITTSGDVISLTDPIVNKEVVRIRSFSCQGSGSVEGDCILEGSTGSAQFVSSYYHTFTKQNGLWYVFGGGMGHRIWASDQYYITLLSQYLDIMGDKLLSDLLRKELKTKCVGPQADVVDYISHKTKEQNGNTFVIIRGRSTSHKIAVCQLKLSIKDHAISFESIATIPVEE